MADKILPHDKQTEEYVLSACLADPQTLQQAVEILHPDDFYVQKNQAIFGAITQLHKNDKPVTVQDICVTAKKKLGAVKADGIGRYLADLLTHSGMYFDPRYAKIIKEYALKRQVIKHAQNLEAACYDTNDVTAVIDEATTSLAAIGNEIHHDQEVSWENRIHDQYARWEKKSKDGGGITGVATGYDIDRILGGFQKTDLIILAARPGMGKTALALNIATNALRAEKRIGMFSLEMAVGQLINRAAASEGRLDSTLFQSGNLSNDWDAVNAIAEKISEWDFCLDDTPGLSYHEIMRRSRRWHVTKPLDLVIIDYLQLATGDQRDGRVREVGSISRNMKNMAKELDVPVLLLSQLSREVDKRPPSQRRPILSDLRDSGEIEQDADVVMFIYREEIYNRDATPGEAEILVAKHRNGRTGSIKLTFLSAYTRFENLSNIRR